MNILIITSTINTVGGVERVLNLLSNYIIKDDEYNISILSLEKPKSESPYFKFDKRINLIYKVIKHLIKLM